MQGDVLTDEDAASRFLKLESYRYYLQVMTEYRIDFRYRALPGKVITCVIAASVHLKGRVSVVEGGYESKTVLIRYDRFITETNEPDIFFVFVQAAKSAVNLAGNVVKTPQLDIVYEPVRNWTQEEVQDALRNVSSIFFSS